MSTLTPPNVDMCKGSRSDRAPPPFVAAARLETPTRPWDGKNLWCYSSSKSVLPLNMVRAAVMLLLAAFPAASAFLPLVTPGRFAPPLARNSGVSALRSPVRHARGLARGAVQLRAAGDDGLLEKIDAEAFEVLLQVAGPFPRDNTRANA